MNHHKLYYLALPLLILAAPASFALENTPIAKQLAGPPEEFELMRAAPPAATATHSKSALLPVQLHANKQGIWQWNHDIPIENGQLRLMMLSNGDLSWQLNMRSAFGFHAQPAENLVSDYWQTEIGIAGNQFPGDFYAFEQLQGQTWSVSVAATQPAQREGFILMSGDNRYLLHSHQTHNRQWVGQRLGFVANASQQGKDGSASKPAVIQTAHLRITGPDGNVWTEPMYDDGLHNDAHAGDGFFGGDFLATRAGEYTAQVVAMSQAPDGARFLRTTEHLVPVIEPLLEVNRGFARAELMDNQRLSVALGVTSRSPDAHYRVLAEVWGRSRDNRSKETPVAWIGGMATTKQGQLNLGLDGRWIARAQAQGPFELRHVRIEDPDHFIPLTQLERLPLDVPRLPESASREFAGIDEAMLMGPRPESLSNRAAGPRLLLVHGYCSEGPWGVVKHQFANSTLFLDLDQNRSHDLFARMIGTFGASYDSFGIVASSQGGAASMHLYTYYWSGLDFAGSGRLIQSVGTPYQGTALAGNLAVLGQIFGAGCGSNSNMTYSGAASWLSGIPSWARAKVNYYTTSFTDKWWRYDYCQIVTDLLLSDPDDGVTERAYGQVSGAINRGHKTGWCHTKDMRDPAQTSDSSRNSTMNINAAR